LQFNNVIKFLDLSKFQNGIEIILVMLQYVSLTSKGLVYIFLGTNEVWEGSYDPIS